MKKNIAVSREAREKIAGIFKVTERTVFKALSADYLEGNDLHKRIRMAARENGGICMVSVPAGEAIYFADGTMRMDLTNGAVLEFRREDGSGHIFFKGKEVASFENVTIPMIYEIQAQAAALR